MHEQIRNEDIHYELGEDYLPRNPDLEMPAILWSCNFHTHCMFSKLVGPVVILALPVMAARAALHVRTLKMPLPAAFCFKAFFFPAAIAALPERRELGCPHCPHVHVRAHARGM